MLIGSTFSESVIGAAIDVHKSLGPGLLESAYQRCLAIELQCRGLPFEAQLRVPLIYRGRPVDCDYRIDFLVGRELVVEIKSADRLLPVHTAQILTYLRILHVPHGLLLNFNSPTLRSGLRSFHAARETYSPAGSPQTAANSTVSSGPPR